MLLYPGFPKIFAIETDEKGRMFVQLQSGTQKEFKQRMQKPSYAADVSEEKLSAKQVEELRNRGVAALDMLKVEQLRLKGMYRGCEEFKLAYEAQFLLAKNFTLEGIREHLTLAHKLSRKRVDIVMGEIPRYRLQPA